MSPTLLEGVAMLIVLVVAWQIGIRLAPEIIRLLREAYAQLLSVGDPKRNADDQPAPKEFHSDREN
jgi:hypothetical protein